MSKPQSASNLFRVDPLHHLVLMPFFLASLIIASLEAAHVMLPGWLYSLWPILTAGAFLLLALKVRMYATALQDRIIRMEEQARLRELMPPAEARDAVSRLSLAQLIALRFAPDAELPALVKRTLADGLTPAAIKQAVVNWRADLIRV